MKRIEDLECKFRSCMPPRAARGSFRAARNRTSILRRGRPCESPLRKSLEVRVTFEALDTPQEKKSEE